LTSFSPTTSSSIEGKGGRKMLLIFSWCQENLGGCALPMKTTEEEEKEEEEKEELQKNVVEKEEEEQKKILQQKKCIEQLSMSKESWQVVFSISIFSQT
jgi:hypothetical protein